MLLLVQPLALVAAETRSTSTDSSLTSSGLLLDPAVERLVDLGRNVDDPRHQMLTFLAQREHSRQLAPGTVEMLDAASTASNAAVALGGLPPPRQIFKESYRVCDLNGDKVDDLIVNQYDYTLQQPKISAIDGETGTTLWNYLGILYYYPIDVFSRDGLPTPWRPDNAQPILDANGNGVCDLMFLGFTFRTRQSTPVVSVAEMIVHVELHEGSTGANIWTRQFEGQYVSGGDPVGVSQVQVVQGFPTGFVVFDTPRGPHFVLKRTDLYYELVQDPVLAAVFVQSMHVSEHVHYANASNGRDVWLRDMEFSSDSDTTNITWISGVGDVTGDGDVDLFLDQHFFYNPRSTNPTQGPVEDLATNGDPIFEYGQGAQALALRGGPAGGDTIWNQVLRDEGYGRVSTQGEELFNLMLWTNAQVIGDLNGDGAPEFVSLILTREYLDASTVNGQFRTILTPLSGTDGTLLWPGSEIRQQGWGFTAPLGAPEEPAQATGDDAVASTPTTPKLLAFGTIDLPTGNVPEGRFPLKDVRITVLDARDGSARWSYGAQFPQDSYLSYHLALEQYLTSLAPLDYDGDGINEVVTPSEFISSSGNNQTLLANAKHRYSILRGTDGEPLAGVTAWGSNGMLKACGDRLLVVSGHGKQIDTSRVNITQFLPDWRETLWIDPSFTSATAGSDVIFLTGTCTPGTDNRTHVGINVGLNSEKRGAEIVPVFGMMYEDKGQAAWLLPRPLMTPDYDFLNKTLIQKLSYEPTRSEQVGWSVAPLVPGALAGVAFAFFSRRKGGGAA